MATSTGKIHCITCRKDKVGYKCEGCGQSFCINHLNEHHQSLIKQLDETEDKRNLFQQTLIERTSNPQKHSLIEQINQWEKDSIYKIQQTADQARQSIIKHNSEHFNQIQIKLTKLTQELKQIRQEEDFNEIHLNEFKQKLKELEEQLNKPSNISIQHENSSSFINKFLFQFLIVNLIVYSSDQIINRIKPNKEQVFARNININTKWIQNGVTVAGGNMQGNGLNQLHSAWGLYVDDDGTIYVADHSNQRIVEWKKGATSGQVVAGTNEGGNRNDQLKSPSNVILDKKNDSLIICDSVNQRVVRWPRRNGTNGEIIIANIACQDVSMDNDGYIYISDYGKNEVRRWKVGETNGTLVAGGNGSGSCLNQLCNPFCIFVDQDQSVYVSDYGNHRVMKWVKGAKEGVVVAGGQGPGNSLKQLSNPRGIVVDQLGTIYVADFSNSRVMRWLKGAREGSLVVGGNGYGNKANQLGCPIDLSFDGENNLYVSDYSNHRIQKFTIDSN